MTGIERQLRAARFVNEYISAPLIAHIASNGEHPFYINDIAVELSELLTQIRLDTLSDVAQVYAAKANDLGARITAPVSESDRWASVEAAIETWKNVAVQAALTGTVEKAVAEAVAKAREEWHAQNSASPTCAEVRAEGTPGLAKVGV